MKTSIENSILTTMETPFLKLVADDLYSKTNGDISDYVLVFPNQRTKLFFNRYYFANAQKTTWAPRSVSIVELITRFSDLKLRASDVTLVYDLFQVYKTKIPTDEPFDEFYDFGKLMLSDFEDIDKNLVNAAALFQNLQGIKELDNKYDYLTDEQKQLLESFFNLLKKRETDIQQKFITIWSVLGEIYTDFRSSLETANSGYSGMLYRQLAEKLQKNGAADFGDNTYVFVGFNVLNKCEEKLFSVLRDAKKALFYWDVDEFYIKQEEPMIPEAGRFIKSYQKNFPNKLPTGDFFNPNKHKKTIRYIKSATENAQARYLRNYFQDKDSANTAIVLSNETLLLPVLHSLSESSNELNITMSFPLSDAPISSFITSFYELHQYGYKDDTHYKARYIRALFYHTYTRQLFEAEKNGIKLFTEYPTKYIASKCYEHLQNGSSTESNYIDVSELINSDTVFYNLLHHESDVQKLSLQLLNLLSQLAHTLKRDMPKDNTEIAFDTTFLSETVFVAYKSLQQFLNLLKQKDIQMELNRFVKLYKQILMQQTVPFLGNPTNGLQIMGVLETRNLDFQNVVMLSVNEGLVPKSGKDVSFIPYNLRKAFGMTTIEHKDSVYAYYFYRILQRAENITILYSENNKTERSRFLTQFKMESAWKDDIQEMVLSENSTPIVEKLTCIQKDDVLVEKLKNYSYSATALNTYLSCPLQFYFTHIAKIEEQKEDDSKENLVLGNVFHHVAQRMYEDKIEKLVTEDYISKWQNNTEEVNRLIDEEMRKELHLEEGTAFNGLQQIWKQNIATYVQNLLEVDKKRCPFTILGLEKEVKDFDLTFPTGATMHLYGKIDRIDEKDGVINIIDYKTGKATDIKIDCNPDKKWFYENKKERGYIVQLLFYAVLYENEWHDKSVEPAIFYPLAKKLKPLGQFIKENKEESIDINKLIEQYKDNLQKLFEEICDEDTPIKPQQAYSATDADNFTPCTYCTATHLCRLIK